MFKFILGCIALIVAGCAAFFSVQGLASLYSGHYIAVCIMAASLEVGKLISASYLHRHWKRTSFLLKSYLISAVFVLMGITSLGIFGFLSSGYQKNYAKVEIVNTKQESVLNKKEYLEKEIDSLTKRIQTLNSAREAQEKRLTNLSSKSAKPIYDDIARSSEEIQKLQGSVSGLSSEIVASEQEIINLKLEKNQTADIGTLQFVADAFGLKIEEIVKWFTLALVTVFDPLAVCLILAYNNINKPTKKEIIEEEIIEDTKNKFAFSNGGKYRD